MGDVKSLLSKLDNLEAYLTTAVATKHGVDRVASAIAAFSREQLDCKRVLLSSADAAQANTTELIRRVSTQEAFVNRFLQTVNQRFPVAGPSSTPSHQHRSSANFDTM